MKYVSIDIETTGLDSARDQILEIGAIFDDGKIDLWKLPRFHCYVHAKIMTGDPFALAMNAEIIKKIANKDPDCMENRQIVGYFANWLTVSCGYDLGSEKVVYAGKNVGSFDLPFLDNNIDGWRGLPRHHRILDPAMLYLKADDKGPLSLADCLERAGIQKSVKHTALEDAEDVVRLIRHGVK